MRTDVVKLRATMRARSLRQARRVISLALAAAFAGIWAAELRPQSLGGPAAYVIVSGTSMLPGLEDGDLVVVRRENGYGPGDVVSYRVPAGEPAAGLQVIHRIIGGDESGYVVQGDNRAEVDLWRPQAGDIVGQQWLRVPIVGRALVVLQDPSLLASLAAAFAAFVGVSRGRRPTDAASPRSIDVATSPRAGMPRARSGC